MRISAHGLVAVHFRHHDVHENHAQVGRGLDEVDGLPAVGGADHFNSMALEQRGEGEDIAGVVVHHEHFAPVQDLVGAVQPLEQLLFFHRQVGHDAMEEQRGLVQQPLGRLDVLEDDALGHGLEPHFIVVGKLLAGEDDDGNILQGWFRLKLLQQLEAAHVRQAQVEHDAVERPVEQGVERLAAGGDGRQLDVLMVEQLDDGLALDVVVLDDQKPFGARGGEVPEAVEGDLIPSVVGDLTR